MKLMRQFKGMKLSYEIYLKNADASNRFWNMVKNCKDGSGILIKSVIGDKCKQPEETKGVK